MKTTMIGHFTGFKSLQRRFVVLILLPVALLLIGAGTIGFVYARNSLLDQWQKTAILELQREAHKVDMLIGQPLRLIRMLNSAAELPRAGHHVLEWILGKLETTEGVERVVLDRQQPHAGRPGGMYAAPHSRMAESMRFHRARIKQILPPHYDSLVEGETVSLISELTDDSGRTVGNLEVVMRFDTLFKDLLTPGVWQSHRAILLDADGRQLYSRHIGRLKDGSNTGLQLDSSALAAMSERPYGTILGKGHPPASVIGFYRLKEAPWKLALVAPGKDVLAPIIQFGWYYLLFGAMFIVFTLVPIRWWTGHTVDSIKRLSQAAGSVANGDFAIKLPIDSSDEVGELTRSFNTMTQQLEDRMRLKQAMHLARQVQQNLIPSASLQVGCLQISGQTNYCDETGGDFYDFIRFPQAGDDMVGIAVGDVVGHGVAAALLMTTARALLRSAAAQSRNLSEVVIHVNRLLCMDTAESGNFMTLFYMVFNKRKGDIRWVRAGHDPAIIYDPANDEFHELNGEGLALGVEESWDYAQYRFDALSPDMVVLIGTDGIWETENEQGEKFGKKNLAEILKKQWRQAPEQIVAAVMAALEAFRQSATQNDDVTLVVLKLDACLDSRQTVNFLEPASS